MPSAGIPTELLLSPVLLLRTPSQLSIITFLRSISLALAEITRHKQFLALFAIPGWQDWSEEKVLAWGQARKAAARLRDAKVRETKRRLDSNKQKDKEARAKEMDRRKVMMESWLGVRRSNTELSSSSALLPVDGIG